MTKTTLNKFYTRTIESKHCEPKDGELESWLDVLGNYSDSQLDAALRRWDRETEVEAYTQRPRGSRMPSPAELRRSIEGFERSASKKFVPCGKCEWGWVRVFDGLTQGRDGEKGSPVDPKRGTMRRCECFLAWASQNRNRDEMKPKRVHE